MVAQSAKLCGEPGCGRYGRYLHPGDRAAGRFCLLHRKEGMVDVEDTRCQGPGCGKTGKYARKGQEKLLYCAEHMEKGMEFVSQVGLLDTQEPENMMV
mmetsp:Transcript_35460/g.55548  ORF Transcript_35460/g.55548 Transcript_35460/m.55548 type:complete len:98 (+) Transcript_35460:3-296(+)